MSAPAPVDTAASSAVNWRLLAPGLELCRFTLPTGVPSVAGTDSPLVVLRIDPAHWDFRLVSGTAFGADSIRTARAWMRDQGLVAATNAGMYHPDYETHVGYMACAGDTNTTAVNSYKSAAAFHPRRPGLAPFRIFDLDATPLADVCRDYGCVVQNLRLVRRPGINVWAASPRRWSEAALGEDREGRALFIFSRAPFTMDELNRHLLALPLGLVAAQHLEGGPEAQLCVATREFRLDLFGSYETGFRPDDTNSEAWRVPNVLGIVAR